MGIIHHEIQLLGSGCRYDLQEGNRVTSWGSVCKLKVHVLFAADKGTSERGSCAGAALTRDDVQEVEVCLVGVTWSAGFGSSVFVSIAA